MRLRRQLVSLVLFGKALAILLRSVGSVQQRHEDGEENRGVGVARSVVGQQEVEEGEKRRVVREEKEEQKRSRVVRRL